ncbi:hypothetical protein Pstr01_41320 [Pseudomonas straminea]|nr:hypothetical protein Pstr01_41320 [Pseudomonas straminea]
MAIKPATGADSDMSFSVIASLHQTGGRSRSPFTDKVNGDGSEFGWQVAIRPCWVAG